MIKINEIKIQPYSTRGLAISFPVLFARDNNLKAGDFIKVYREKTNDSDLLIISTKELPHDFVELKEIQLNKTNN